MIDSEELKPVLVAMQEASGMNEKQMNIANNSLEYDETVVSNHLERAYRGAVLALQEDYK